jgi:pimeloyl-ACP methyl ester carboxylesterase
MGPSNASAYFDANGIRHHYLHWGNAKNPCLILLHGIRSYAKTWINTAERLKDRFYVVALDLRGRGESGWSADKQYYYPDYVSDLEALVNHLEIEHFYLLGHSLGGQNALLYAAKHPDHIDALIVEDIGPGSSASGQGAARIVREFSNTPAKFDGWEEATAFWRSIRPGISEESLAQRVRETLKEANGKVIWSYDFVGIKDARLAAAADTSLLPDLWPAVENLRSPTLVMRGARSDFLSRETQEAMAESNAVIETAEISGATHYVHDDNFEEFYSVLNSFLDRCLKSDSGCNENT